MGMFDGAGEGVMEAAIALSVEASRWSGSSGAFEQPLSIAVASAINV